MCNCRDFLAKCRGPTYFIYIGLHIIRWFERGRRGGEECIEGANERGEDGEGRNVEKEHE